MTVRQSMRPIHAVIFDLDDTLYAEKTYTFSGYRAVAQAHADILGDADKAFRRMCELFDSPNRARVFNVMLEEVGHHDAENTIMKMVETFRNHPPTIELYPEAAAVLKALRPDYKLGIISDGFLVAQQNKVASLQVDSKVDEVVLTDALGREFWKPHHRAFELIADKLQVSHEACTYIADNLAKDFVAPNALGWTSIHIDRPDGIHRANPAPSGGHPAHEITSLAKLPELLLNLA